jgi:hypothetical protein
MSELKELAMKLVAACEHFYLEKCVYQVLLEGAHVQGWQTLYEENMRDPQMIAANRKTFAPIYDAIEREGDSEEAVRRVLKLLPKPEMPN